MIPTSKCKNNDKQIKTCAYQYKLFPKRTFKPLRRRLLIPTPTMPFHWWLQLSGIRFWCDQMIRMLAYVCWRALILATSDAKDIVLGHNGARINKKTKSKITTLQLCTRLRIRIARKLRNIKKQVEIGLSNHVTLFVFFLYSFNRQHIRTNTTFRANMATQTSAIMLI